MKTIAKAILMIARFALRRVPRTGPRTDVSLAKICGLLLLLPQLSPAQTVILSEGFEGAFPGGWLVGDSSGIPAYWDDVDLRTFGSPPTLEGNWAGYCAGIGFAGTTTSPLYQHSMAAYMSRSINLSGYASATLTFWYVIPSIENCFFGRCDYLRVMIDNDEVFFRGSDQPSWTQVSVNLNAYVGASHTLKFEFVSDGSFRHEGAYVDDILVIARADLPNLTPYQPSGWSDKIVASTNTGDNSDDSPIYEDQDIYVDWAIWNESSTANIPQRFYTQLLIDGQFRADWSTDGLNARFFAAVRDYAIGRLSVGTHTLRIVTDYTGVVNESNESDNGYTKTITISRRPDTVDPTVNSFSVAPNSAHFGTPFTITYTVSDAGGSGLARVELWRAPDSGGSPGAWSEVQRNAASGDGPVSDSFSDLPPSPGMFWYGLHAVDNAGNFGVEPNPPGAIKITVFPADPNDQLNEATVLGSMTQTWIKEGSIDVGSDVDMFSFTVITGQRIAFDIDLPSPGLDSYLRLFDSNGNQLSGGSNDDAPGPGETPTFESYLEYDFAAGATYYVGVSGLRNINYNAVTGAGDTEGSTGSYTLVVSPGLAGVVVRDGQTFPVDILQIAANPRPINANQRTWIIIHGWNSSRTNSEGANIPTLAQAIADRRIDDQVLTLNWSDAAASPIINPCPAANAIIPVAEWAARALQDYGFSGANLNLVGHSYGSYVSGETAERMTGGVNTIIALDPALDYPPCSYAPNSQNDFDDHTGFSWAFHTSFWGSEFTPTTADESFVIPHYHDCFPFCSIAAHSRAAGVFTYMLENSNGAVSRLFQLERLLSHTRGPWSADQYRSHAGDDTGGDLGYEGVVLTVPDSDSVLSITYVCEISGQEITVQESGETIPPDVTAFSVSPSSVIVGSAFTISWVASDCGGSGLNRVALCRAPDVGGSPGTWEELQRMPVSGDGPISGSFSDSPPAPGTYWYGVNAVDNAGNVGFEPNPPGPSRVTVVPDTLSPTVTITSHSDGQTVSTSTITVSGTATDAGRGENGISSVTVNGVRANNDTAMGSGIAYWDRTIILNPGDNSVSVVARDGSPNQNEASRTIILTYMPPDQWVPYVPSPQQTTISISEASGIWKANVAIDFPDSGYRVADWGTAVRSGNSFIADALVERWTGISLPVVTTDSHDYDLGPLSPGSYVFVFRAWGTEVERQNFGVVAVACTAPASGMVGWWPGDSSAHDVVGINHGVMQNGATFAAGKVGQAFSFDGTDDFVEVPDSDLWAFGSSDFTVEFWVNFNVVKRTMLIGQSDHAGDDFNKWFIEYWNPPLGASSRLHFHINSPTLPELYPVVVPFFPAAGSWYHIAVTRSGSNYRLYTNGILGATGMDTNAIPNPSVPLTIGQVEFTPGEVPYYMNGLIDEVSIYRRALEGSEIQAVYNAESAGKCRTPCHVTVADANTLALYYFEEVGLTAQDSSGNAWDGTLQNGASRTNLGATIGNALLLDGINDYVSIPPAMLNNLPEGTVEATVWVESFVPNFGTPIISKGNTALTEFVLVVTPDSIGVHGGRMDGFTVPAEIPVRTWTRVAVSWNGAVRKLYVNDELVGQESSPFAPPNHDGNPVQIGRHNHINGPFEQGFHFPGQIDNVRFSRVARPFLGRIPHLAVPVRTRSGAMQITLHGKPGVAYVLQGSPDLTNAAGWTSISTNSDACGINVFIDPEAPNFNQRFYRAVSQPGP